MTLNEFVAQKKRSIFESLAKGLPPQEGRFDEAVWKEGQAKGSAQIGKVEFHPRRLVLEFIYSDPRSSATILRVELDPPERIVFLPVPEWVVETIWQGEIDGSYHFESHALAHLRTFEAETGESANEKWFGPARAKRRE